jgi:hypothetical protein
MKISKTEERMILVRDAVRGALSQYNSKDVFILPILDAARLLQQHAHIVSFISENQREPIYTTLHDDELTELHRDSIDKLTLNNKNLISLDGEKPRVLIQKMKIADKIEKPSFVIDNNLIADYRELFQLLLKEEQGQAAIKTIINLLPSSPFKSEPSRKLSDVEYSEDDISEITTPMRNIVDNALEDHWESALLRTFPGKSHPLPFPNAFAVIRTATMKNLRRGYYNYTAQLLLSFNQIEQIQKLLHNNDSSLLNNMQLPLGEHARSIADSVFRSGLIDFSSELPGKGRDIAGDGMNDLLRQAAEKEVYSKVFQGGRPFYIPIHIEGVPWIALFTLTLQDANKKNLSWSHNFQFYRSQVPKIADKFRDGTTSMYLELLSVRLRRNLNDLANSSNDKFNIECQKLLVLCPFKGIRLSETTVEGDAGITLHNGKKIYFEQYKNPFFDVQIPYHQLKLSTITKHFQNVVNEEERIILESDHQFRVQLDAQEHTIFNLLPYREIELALLTADNTLSSETRRWITDEQKAMDILNISLRMTFQRKEEVVNLLKVGSIFELLKWFEKRVLSTEMMPIIKYSNNPLDIKLESQSIPDAFTVIWNLWDNAGKKGYKNCSTELFEINVEERKGCLLIEFANGGEMDKQWIDYLQKKAPFPEQKRISGLKIVIEALVRLGWTIDNIVIVKGITRISIAIPNYNGVKNANSIS